MTEHLKVHPAANRLRMMSPEEYQRLVASIKAHGLRDAIELDEDGEIADGRNRYKACLELGIKPKFRRANLKGLSYLEYSVIKNVDRRHLTKSEKALLAIEIRNYMRLHNDTTSFAVELSSKPPQEDNWDNQEPPPGDPSMSDLASALDVSPTYIKKASHIKDHGCPELEQAVRSGAVKIQAAAKLATFPKLMQQRALEEGPGAVKALITKPTEESETTESRMAEWNSECESWARKVAGLANAIPRCPLVDPGIMSTIESHLTAAAGSMRTAKSHALCPRCNGGGCTFCAELGFVNRVTYESNHH